MSAAPSGDPRSPGTEARPVDALAVTARFARSSSSDAPCGVLVLEGHAEPIPFAGWLDLMAIVEGLLEDARSAER